MRVSVGFTRDFKRLWCGREDLARVELGRLRTKRAWFLTTVNLGSPPVVMSYRSPRCPRHGGGPGFESRVPAFQTKRPRSASDLDFLASGEYRPEKLLYDATVYVDIRQDRFPQGGERTSSNAV
jgi:hypothetical protein